MCEYLSERFKRIVFDVFLINSADSVVYQSYLFEVSFGAFAKIVNESLTKSHQTPIRLAVKNKTAGAKLQT